MGFTTPIFSSLLGALSRLGIIVFHRVGGGGGQDPFLTQVVAPTVSSVPGKGAGRV